MQYRTVRCVVTMCLVACSPAESRLDAGRHDARAGFDAEPPDAGGSGAQPARDLGLPAPPYDDLWRFDHFLAAYRELRCAQHVYCEDGRDSDLLEDPWLAQLDVWACHPVFVADEVRRHRTELDAGRLRYDAASARRCLETFDTRLCSAFEEPVQGDTSCLDVFTASTVAGGRCPEGGLVAVRERCPEGTICHAVDDACPICVPREVAVADGRLCELTCELGEVCRDGECGPPSGAGDPCGDYVWCRRGLECVDGVCVTAAALGQPCDDATHCQLYLWCDEGVCRSWNELEIGDPCFLSTGSWDALFEICPPPLRCALGGCQIPGTAGAFCDITTRCAFGHRCVKNRCRETAMPGAACDGDLTVCPYSHECVHQRCVPRPLRGEPCVPSSLRCLEGACVDGACRLLDAGMPCEQPFPGLFPVCRDGACDGRCGGSSDACDELRCFFGDVCVRDADGFPTCGSRCDR